MTDVVTDEHAHELEARMRAAEHRLGVAEAASGFGTFEIDLDTHDWNWSRQVALLFGLDPQTAGRSFKSWESAIFVDDVPKVHEAFRAARRTGTFYIEFRVKHSDGRLHWIGGKGQVAVGEPSSTLLGALFEITERKALEARLLAVNETLEARVLQVREEARTLELLNRTGVAVAAELDLQKLVQLVTDAGVELSHAEFGAFFYNVTTDTGESSVSGHLDFSLPRPGRATAGGPRSNGIRQTRARSSQAKCSSTRVLRRGSRTSTDWRRHYSIRPRP